MLTRVQGCICYFKLQYERVFVLHRLNFAVTFFFYLLCWYEKYYCTLDGSVGEFEHEKIGDVLKRGEDHSGLQDRRLRRALLGCRGLPRGYAWCHTPEGQRDPRVHSAKTGG